MEYLIDFILGLSAGERGLYVIGFVFLGYKGIIKLPFIPIGKKKSKKHSECPLYPDMLKRGEIKAEIVEIEKRIQLRQQMNVIEASNIDIIYELQDTYTTICNSRADKKYYSKLIALVEKKCFEPMIRTWLKENHYTSQSEEKFTAYIVKKTGMLLGILKRELKDDYDDTIFAIPLESLEEVNKTIFEPKAKEIWNQMFRDCREVARVNEERIAVLRKRLDNE